MRISSKPGAGVPAVDVCEEAIHVLRHLGQWTECLDVDRQQEDAVAGRVLGQRGAAVSGECAAEQIRDE